MFSQNNEEYFWNFLLCTKSSQYFFYLNFFKISQVIYPFRPLFSVEEKKLSMKCQKALARIFKVNILPFWENRVFLQICDANNDGLLSDSELKEFQMFSFGVPLTTAAVEVDHKSHDKKNEIRLKLRRSNKLFLNMTIRWYLKML